jgi:hypothetical protein
MDRRVLRSKRQRTLIERLVTLGDWASNRGLPLDVIEIRGFGSFFRGKPNAKDVDLFLRCERHPHRENFTHFLEVVDHILDKDVYEQTCKRPSDALQAFFEGPDAGHVIASINEADCQLFIRWLEPFSWNMLCPQTIHGQIEIENPDIFAKKAIRYHLPNLNVVELINREHSAMRSLGLRCGFTVTVWSAETQNVRSNLDELLSEASIETNLLSELGYFRVQVAVMKATRGYAQAKLFLSLGGAAVSTDSGQDADDDRRGVPTELVAPLAYLRKIQAEAKEFDDHKCGTGWPGPGDVPSSQDAAALVQELRDELKTLYREQEWIKDMQRYASAFWSGDPYSTDRTVSAYVKSRLLERGRSTDKAKKLRLFEKLGF